MPKFRLERDRQGVARKYCQHCRGGADTVRDRVMDEEPAIRKRAETQLTVWSRIFPPLTSRGFCLLPPGRSEQVGLGLRSGGLPR